MTDNIDTKFRIVFLNLLVTFVIHSLIYSLSQCFSWPEDWFNARGDDVLFHRFWVSSHALGRGMQFENSKLREADRLLCQERLGKRLQEFCSQLFRFAFRYTSLPSKMSDELSQIYLRSILLIFRHVLPPFLCARYLTYLCIQVLKQSPDMSWSVQLCGKVQKIRFFGVFPCFLSKIVSISL